MQPAQAERSEHRLPTRTPAHLMEPKPRRARVRPWAARVPGRVETHLTALELRRVRATLAQAKVWAREQERARTWARANWRDPGQGV